jgi:hypothetical protein|tara:strand:+ start:277 stop:534 length:258 start_codon:yes stop_codon:yes gene_type:complete
MFSFYSSISRLLGSNSKKLNTTESYTSLYPNINIKENVYTDMMLSPDFSKDKIISKNDVGEVIILEYSKHDKTFRDYRPKFFKYK